LALALRLEALLNYVAALKAADNYDLAPLITFAQS